MIRPNKIFSEREKQKRKRKGKERKGKERKGKERKGKKKGDPVMILLSSVAYVPLARAS
jgi:hypothetical protein